METNIRYKGVDLVVEGNYSPPEEQIRYYSDGSGYPGANSEFEVSDVFVRDSFISVFNLFSAENLSEIEEICLIEIEER
jgi:hypothetical protein